MWRKLSAFLILCFFVMTAAVAGNCSTDGADYRPAATPRVLLARPLEYVG